jgi:two-component system chemotaxis response regulator CheY
MSEGLDRLRVLVVDDNAQMRQLIGAILGGAGVRHLHYAADGRRGLDALADFRPDLVLVDDEMPVMRGLDFVGAVRAMPDPVRRLPIIMVTSHADAGRLQEARRRGVNYFIRKPVSAAEILKRLEAVLKNPRPFVDAKTYVGPERRIRTQASADNRRS